MTPSRGDARAWLAWALAGGAVATASRNPILLGLLLLVALAVWVRLAPRSAIGRDWWHTGRLVLWLAGLSIVFNLATVRAGDTPLLTLPADWPVLGGVLTLNALVHGLLAALAMLAILSVWAVFNAVIDHGDLLRLTPRPLYLAGAVGSVALTFLPGLARAVRQIGEAQAMRGHQVRGARDLVPLAAPLLNLGLERGLNLAEAMEARGFGAPGASVGSWQFDGGARHATDARFQPSAIRRPNRFPPDHQPPATWLVPAGLVALAGGGLLALGSPWPLLGGALLALGLLAIWLGLRAAGPGRTRYRRRRWTGGDTAVTVTAALAIVALVAARLAGDPGLDYAVYPALRPPPVSPFGLVATLLLLAPAVCAEAGWQ